jgi:hypothetical protein
VSTRHSVDWFIPVRSCGDIATLRTGRTPDGARVGVAFSTLAQLVAASGRRQDWLRMSEDNLRDVLAPLGITRIQLDAVTVVVAATSAVAS